MPLLIMTRPLVNNKKTKHLRKKVRIGRRWWVKDAYIYGRIRKYGELKSKYKCIQSCRTYIHDISNACREREREV